MKTSLDNFSDQKGVVAEFSANLFVLYERQWFHKKYSKCVLFG